MNSTISSKLHPNTKSKSNYSNMSYIPHLQYVLYLKKQIQNKTKSNSYTYFSNRKGRIINPFWEDLSIIWSVKDMSYTKSLFELRLAFKWRGGLWLKEGFLQTSRKKNCKSNSNLTYIKLTQILFYPEDQWMLLVNTSTWMSCPPQEADSNSRNFSGRERTARFTLLWTHRKVSVFLKIF